jgi:hypothetical protein
MFDDVIYNRHMFYRDKLYEYKRFCERIATSKTRCHPPPPIEYPFLKHRMKKHQMEKEKQDDIEYNKNLLIKKYKSMYKNHNNYHPSNLHFLSLPPSLKFSSGTQYYYELVHQNNYLGNKIKQIQNGIGNYNSDKNIKEYKKAKELGDKIAERSKYKNMLLNLISPFTYEKRLNKLLEKKKKEKKNFTMKAKPKFYNTARGFYRANKNNDLSNIKEKESITSNFENEKKIVIERENMMTTTKEETV